VLRRLNLNGLELVTGQHVQQFLGSPDPNDSGYRRRVRTLHNLRPVYRSCAAHGLLPDDPLKDITNRTFDAYAQRDFLPPDELARLRDLTTVDMDNWQQVRDRLVCLLYADTALRRTELANVDSSQVHRLPDGNCEIILRPAGQKMTGKPGVNQQILYPETQKLLDFYLTRIRPKFGSDGLIVDEKGHRASEHACSAAVQREAQRLALKTYYGKGPPTPHALRRTFGTCNAKPLGLAMDVAEIAEHLRDGVQVVYQHYIVRNPLRARSRGAAYRKQGSPQSVPQGNVDAALAVLQNCGTSAAHLAAIRAELQKRRQPELVPITGKPDHLVQWATEEEAFLLLSTAWAAMPRPRDLRSYLRRQGVCKPVGKRGELLYDRDAVAQLADGYRPWQANGLTRGWTRLNLRRLLNEYSAVRMGGVRLFKREVLVQIKERLVEKLES
jgi:site-specific recombinase XerD